MSEQYYECPKCGKDDFIDGIIVGEWENDGDNVWRAYSCECGFEWRDVYTFSQNETADEKCDILDEHGDPIKETPEEDLERRR